MTARKPKPKPRKASGPSLEQRVAELEEVMSVFVEPRIEGCRRRIDILERQARDISEHLRALESRASLRDKSHDEPVSNAGEAIGQHFSIVGERAPWWRRLIGFMGAP